MKKNHLKTTTKQLELPLVNDSNIMNNTELPPQVNDLQKTELGAIMLEKSTFDKLSKILKLESFSANTQKLHNSKNSNPAEVGMENSMADMTIKVGWNVYVRTKSLNKKTYAFLAIVFVMRVLLIVLKITVMLLIYWLSQKI